MKSLNVLYAFTLAASLVVSACGDSSPEQPSPQGPTTMLSDMATTDLPKIPAPVAAATPCPTFVYHDTGASDPANYALAPMLNQHPNPACSRDLVCAPMGFWTSFPFCAWRQIQKGDEGKSVWINMPGVSNTVMNVIARETTSRAATATTIQSSTWREYLTIGATDQVTVIEAVQPDLPPTGQGTFERLRFTSARTFVKETCPRNMPNAAPYNANCGIWLP